MTARSPHPFRPDPDLPPDVKGRQVCRCGLVGEPDDAHHQVPDVPEQAEHRRRAGDDTDSAPLTKREG